MSQGIDEIENEFQFQLGIVAAQNDYRPPGTSFRLVRGPELGVETRERQKNQQQQQRRTRITSAAADYTVVTDK
jgi:hypothetical protein